VNGVSQIGVIDKFSFLAKVLKILIADCKKIAIVNRKNAYALPPCIAKHKILSKNLWLTVFYRICNFIAIRRG